MKQEKILDAHVHLPWQDEFDTVESKYIRLKEELKKNNENYAIVIADSIKETNIGNNEEVLNVIKNDPNLFMIFGYSPLEGQEEQLIQAETYLKNNWIKGIKLYPGHENFSMNDISLKAVFDLCIKYNVPLTVHTEWNADIWPQYSHPQFIREIAKKYPDLNIVCSHMWLAKALFSYNIIKDLSNVYIDISAFMMGEDLIKKHGFPDFEECINILQTLTKEIPDRIIYGSDYGSLSIKDHLELIEKADIDPLTKHKLLFENANRVYRLGL